jgi:serine/threonine protein kinase
MLMVTSPHLLASQVAGSPLRGEADLEDGMMDPLYELGSTIGTGGTSVVVHGESTHHERGGHQRGGHHEANTSPSSPRRQRGLAVKVIRKDSSETQRDIERSVMWEVHVLQKLHHEHIVRVMDVIEVVDATYIIMERVDGPELTDFIRMHESGRLPSSVARPLLVRIVLALRHAHQNGFLHCDVKPDNIRMNRECDCAILTDWGFAREPGCRPENYMCGTPQYASPEQLTGYCPD